MVRDAAHRANRAYTGIHAPRERCHRRSIGHRRSGAYQPCRCTSYAGQWFGAPSIHQRAACDGGGRVRFHRGQPPFVFVVMACIADSHTRHCRSNRSFSCAGLYVVNGGRSANGPIVHCCDPHFDCVGVGARCAHAAIGGLWCVNSVDILARGHGGPEFSTQLCGRCDHCCHA